MRLLNKLMVFGSLAAAVASADTITLKSGQTYEGTFLGGNAREVRLDVNGEPRTFTISQVQSITFPSDRTPAAETPRNLEGAPRLRRVDPSVVSGTDQPRSYSNEK